MPRTRFKLGTTLPIGLLLVALTGAWLLFSRTGQPVHPDPAAIPSVTGVAAPPEWAGAAAAARQLVRTHISAGNLPGVSVAVGVGGEIVWSEGFGWADLETRAPVTPETRFRIGTASTLLTSAAVGVLVEHGRLSLDEEIQTYVPEYPQKQWPVTLRQLMAGVAGLGGETGEPWPLLRRRCEHPAEALSQFQRDALLFEPGAEYRQSNYGWILVSAAVESAAGEPFLDFMRDEVFQPLGMDDTGAESPSEENPERIGEAAEDAPLLTLVRQVFLEPLGIAREIGAAATVPTPIYAPGLGHDPAMRYSLHVLPARNSSCYAGSMAFFSTPSDMARFGSALNQGALLRPETLLSLHTPHQLASGRPTGHGLGWDLRTVRLADEPAQAVGRDGEFQGLRVASLTLLPERGIVVAVMSNLADADASALTETVAEQFAR